MAIVVVVGMRLDVVLVLKRVTRVLGYFVNKAVWRDQQCHNERHRSLEEVSEKRCVQLKQEN